MKILTVINDKGGVGKTFLAVQLAFYSALKFGLRTAVIDLDGQGNTSYIIRKSGKAAVSSKESTALLSLASSAWEQDPAITGTGGGNKLVLFPAPANPKTMTDLIEQSRTTVIELMLSLEKQLTKLEPYFDLVIIDNNPNPDVRSRAALCACTNYIIPFQATQESINGIDTLMDRAKGLEGVNENLKSGFVGLIPSNVLGGSQLQVSNVRKALAETGPLMMTVPEYVEEQGRPV